MRYSITARWNGTLCLAGGATAAMAADTCKRFFDSFTGADFEVWRHAKLGDLLDTILAMGPGHIRVFEWADETGRGEFVIRH